MDKDGIGPGSNWLSQAQTTETLDYHNEKATGRQWELRCFSSSISTSTSKSLTYLGSIVSKEDGYSDDVKSRIAKTQGVISQLFFQSLEVLEN